MKYVVIGLALGAAIYLMTGYAFDKGYMQGYVEGRERALMDESEIFTQCTAWWFGGNEPLAMKEINKYCERRKR